MPNTLMRQSWRKPVDELSQLIVDLIQDGKTVEFFSLGSFSLASRGKVEVKRSKTNWGCNKR